jgi:hypothetical protein
MVRHLAEIEASYTLACRTYPLSDLVLAVELVGCPEARHYHRDD